MEMNSPETLEKGEDTDLAGNPSQIYSMGSSHAGRNIDTDEGENAAYKAQNKDSHADGRPKPQKKSNEKKPTPEEEAAAKKKQILTWRTAVGVLVILLILGGVYFIAKGINWGISKVSGKSASVSYVPSLRSVADPNSALANAPVISNMNIYPTGTSSSTPVGSTNTNSAISSNNCPAYLATQYYYCEWIDSVNFRPYSTKEEYDSAHQQRVVNSNYNQNSPQPYVQPYNQPSYTQPPQQVTYVNNVSSNQTSSQIAANGCPSYTASEYAYCIWYDRLNFRGFRAGE